MKGDYHVLPLNDLKQHEESFECECKPKIVMHDEEGNLLRAKIILHTAWDGREWDEAGLPEFKDLRL